MGSSGGGARDAELFIRSAEIFQILPGTLWADLAHSLNLPMYVLLYFHLSRIGADPGAEVCASGVAEAFSRCEAAARL